MKIRTFELCAGYDSQLMALERASIYKAQRDSINRELSIAQTKKEYIEKDLEGWDLFYWKFGMISFWVVSLMLVTMIFFLTVKYKKKLFY